MSTNDETFIKYLLVVIAFLVIGIATFYYVDFKKTVEEGKELRNISYGIMSNYTNLQEIKDMSCFVNLEFEVEQKKVKLFLDEDMTTATCGDQIVQFTHYAMKSPFTLEVIEFP